MSTRRRRAADREDGSVSPAGRLLRLWRAARGKSQLALALDAGISARHLSFVETGRATPGRELVLALSEVLDLPLRERNALLEAAGYARVYRETDLSDPEMKQVHKVLGWILRGTEPHGAVVLDRYWNIAMSNGGWSRLVSAFSGPREAWASDQPNSLRLIFHPRGLRPSIVNWEEVARAALTRIHREWAGTGPDQTMRVLLEELLSYSEVPSLPDGLDPRSPPTILVPLHLRNDQAEMRVFSTITTVGAPQDITLQELRVEAFVPADEVSEKTMAGLAERDASC